MHTINQLAVKLHQEVVATLLRNLKAMPDDKLTWKPLGQGRTVLSQLQECAIMYDRIVRRGSENAQISGIYR